MTRIYTKLGDDGSTGLLFGGRVRKTDPVIEAVGAIDETVAALGVARCLLDDPLTLGLVVRLQRDLFVVAADLVTNPHHRDRLSPRVSLVVPEMVDDVEREIDHLTALNPLRPVFVVPGSTRTSAALDVARAVVRRAERRVVEIADEGGEVNPLVRTYLNRLSDLLYVLARSEAADEGELPSHE